MHSTLFLDFYHIDVVSQRTWIQFLTHHVAAAIFSRKKVKPEKKAVGLSGVAKLSPKFLRVQNVDALHNQLQGAGQLFGLS